MPQTPPPTPPLMWTNVFFHHCVIVLFQYLDIFFTFKVNKMAYTAKDPCPPRRFLYLTEKKLEGGEEGKNVHLKTHATARGVGKNYVKSGLGPKPPHPLVDLIHQNVFFYFP